MTHTTTRPVRVKTHEGVPRTSDVATFAAARAKGRHPLRAVVGSLAAHRMWWRPSDVMTAAAAKAPVTVNVSPAHGECDAEVSVAAAAPLAVAASCAGSERRVLLIACSLTSSSVGGIPINRGRGVNHRNRALPLDGIANRWHDHRLTHHITGRMTPHPVGGAR